MTMMYHHTAGGAARAALRSDPNSRALTSPDSALHVRNRAMNRGRTRPYPPGRLAARCAPGSGRHPQVANITVPRLKGGVSRALPLSRGSRRTRARNRWWQMPLWSLICHHRTRREVPKAQAPPACFHGLNRGASRVRFSPAPASATGSRLWHSPGASACLAALAALFELFGSAAGLLSAVLGAAMAVLAHALRARAG